MFYTVSWDQCTTNQIDIDWWLQELVVSESMPDALALHFAFVKSQKCLFLAGSLSPWLTRESKARPFLWQIRLESVVLLSD